MIIVSIFLMRKDEKIARHRHIMPHTTSVAAGQSEVEIYSDLPLKFQMQSDHLPVELPPDIDHEIRAIEDGTIVVNISVSVDGVSGKDGGIILVGDAGWDKDDRPKFANPAEEQAYMRVNGFPKWPALDK